MIPTRIPGYSERQNRALQRIVELMVADENRAEARYRSHRRHDRLPFRGTVQVCQPTPAFPVPSEAHPTAVFVWAYNLSSGGIGFVAPKMLAEGTVVIGLKLPDGKMRWMPGRIVRVRRIPQEEFFDYGVVFEQAASAPAPANETEAVLTPA